MHARIPSCFIPLILNPRSGKVILQLRNDFISYVLLDFLLQPLHMQTHPHRARPSSGTLENFLTSVSCTCTPCPRYPSKMFRTFSYPWLWDSNIFSDELGQSIVWTFLGASLENHSPGRQQLSILPSSSDFGWWMFFPAVGAKSSATPTVNMSIYLPRAECATWDIGEPIGRPIYLSSIRSKNCFSSNVAQRISMSVCRENR